MLARAACLPALRVLLPRPSSRRAACTMASAQPLRITFVTGHQK